jgi:hypothetical protein
MSKVSSYLPEVHRLLVEEGLPVANVACQVGLSPKRVYDLVRRHKLPSNRPVASHSSREHQLLRALAVFPREAVLRLYSLSPRALERELLRIREEERCLHG